MRFVIDSVSDGYGRKPKPYSKAEFDGKRWFVEVSSLEELRAIADERKENLIIRFNEPDVGNSISVYDGYNE